MRSWLVLQRPGFAPEVIEYPTLELAQAAAQGQALLHPAWQCAALAADSRADAVSAFRHLPPEQS